MSPQSGAEPAFPTPESATMTAITERLNSVLADRDRIERHLGEGGMGPLITLMNTDAADV